MTGPATSAQLHAAVRDGTAAEVTALLAAGAPVTERDEDGWTALDHAAGRGEVEVVRALLDAGADPLAAGTDEHTAYRVALAAGRVEAARLLREAERAADPDLPERRPWLPYCRAYPESAVRAFPGWPAGGGPAAEAPDGEREAGIVYLHDDLAVTRSIWRDDEVLLDGATPGWADFATGRLSFEVPDELDLAVERPA